MLRQALQRVLLGVPILLGVLLLGFLLMQVMPADPAMVRAGPMATQDVLSAIRHELGLDQPLWWQFLIYLGRLAHGDLGVSIINNVPVSQELGSTVGPTLELMVTSLIWAIPLGITLGTVGAYVRGSILDRAIMALSVAGVSVPVFFLGLTLVWLFGYRFPILPFTGRAGPVWRWEGLQGIILPAVTLGGIFVGPVARMTRSSVLDVLGADHVRTARAKGLPERSVLLRHGLRNALIPVVTLIGLQIGFLLGGAVVTETVFSWPGVGRLIVGAIVSADVPVAQGAVILLSVGFILINIAVDLLYAVLDPRVRGAV
ncbi:MULTISPECIES: ABC transporter permease [unclassified Bradyrhizobium]|uniref:ABC transporter permease n=1 Tax=Bradyrhizobium sp. USDA 4541 TaxID=2817704 RepID=UPI0020A29C05|nr:ABC transporter permease [Bradyrhizobium sp. USDA 4541]MCP1848126.1 ABC-type dipeptide/oligopeptide/nickel transport system permease component [Bradyrhizobium sp. USDA 4541]